MPESERTSLLPAAYQVQLSRVDRVEAIPEDSPAVVTYGAVSPPPLVSFQKKHHRDFSRESGFETDITRQSSTLSSVEDLTEDLAETEDDSLFAYMERETARVEDELEKAKLWDRDGTLEENLDMDSTVLNINREEGDFESITIAAEYVSVEQERKQCRSAFGVLYNLKLEISRLLSHLEMECAKLDRLMVGDNMSHAEESPNMYTSKRDEFKGRLCHCLCQVGGQMEKVRHRESIIIDGVRYKCQESRNNRDVRKMPIDCLTWCHMFLFMVLLAMICYMYLWSKASDEWTIYLRMVRSPILVVLLLFFYGINMKVWAMFKVDYSTRFAHPPLATPTPRYVFRVASVLTVAMTFCVICIIVSTPFEAKLPIKIIPLVMWFILLAFVLNPFNVFERMIRYNFVFASVRIFISPLVLVDFSDFFLADQFKSDVGLFLDIQYLICYLTCDSWTGRVDSNICTSSGNGIRPIVSLLPSLWRFLQCLRCFYDTRKAKHLINAGKYFSSLPVVVLSTVFAARRLGLVDLKEMFEMWETKVIVSLWLLSLLVNTIYSFLWDVCCDWGLWDLKCGFFKRKLIFRFKSIYVLAMVVDFVLRFFWTLKLTLAIVWEKDSDLIFTGLVLAEMFRRFIWNFFRVEYAHVLSVNKEGAN